MRQYSEFVANELFSALNLSYIKGKHVIDIGTRDGANALMMLNKMQAQSVTAIDRDASKFPQKNGNVSFLKASLQKFAKTNAMIYDVVTIFLWNIRFKELSDFMFALKKITKPESVVVIGIHDHIYMYDQTVGVPNLFRKHGYCIATSTFYGHTNRYILYAYRLDYITEENNV